MSLNHERLQYLLRQNAARSCSREELNELYSIVNTVSEKELDPILFEQFKAIDKDSQVSEVDWDHMLKQVKEKASQNTIPAGRMVWIRRTAVAASLVFILGTAAWLFYQNDTKKAPIAEKPAQLDVKAPETNRAMITLSNGQKVYLDNVANGSLAQVGNIKVVKLADGKIAYQTTSGEIIRDMQYNTLTNPRGSQVVDMTLSDGSKVWLNAGSSITYPVVFLGNERVVKMDGEAYFEIAHNAQMPFKVSKGNMEVQVLGTHFNVNAYDDEEDIKVTLLEGAIDVTRGKDREYLRPGQMAQINDGINIMNDADLDLVMAWKDGFFSFKGATIEEMLRQIARWYDVSVKFEGQIPNRKFGGKIHRGAKLSQVLKILEESSIEYTISDKELLIKSKQE